MRVVFVHTPMATVPVPERRRFWRNFDIQYHSTHPELRHMKRVLWELPHWMHWLGGVLEAAGYDDLRVLDFYSDDAAMIDGTHLNAAVVDAAVRREAGDVYLFSPMTPNLHMAYEVAEIIKKANPDATTVFGGVIATPMRERVAAHPAVDFVVYDRGEVALPALLDAIVDRGKLAAVGNLTYQDGGQSRTNAGRYQALHPKEIPFPKVDLFPRSAGSDIRYLRQVYALGCPYKCTFCTIQTIGQKPSYFPVDRVLDEIDAYRARYGGHHGIYWGDETFTLHTPRTLELCEALELRGDIQYDCQTRLNRLTEERVLAALKRSGCQWIEIGIETGAQESQDIHKNRMRVNAIDETLKQIRDAGLAACAFAVNGFPEQSPDDMRRSIDWLCDLISRDLLQASYLFGLVPYPGSAMYENPESFGMSLLHEDYARYHEDLPPVFSTAKAGPDEAYDVFIEGLDCLADAMEKTPYFGKAPDNDDLDAFGAFWSGAHV
ncbi:MAG TPA: radical SAM protein [Galbitalea sp.]|nr:radical SAM protein [Galbitalea sp.]